jgi:hypothetical protein
MRPIPDRVGVVARQGVRAEMLRLLAGSALVLTGADHVTTWLCLRMPVSGWEVTEANPVADWLFGLAGLVPGLFIDSVVTLGAVAFLFFSTALPTSLKTAFLALITFTTGFAVLNNVQAIDAMGLWPI